MKERYERPIIIKNQSGFANKYGYSNQPKIISEIDNISIEKLTQKYGSPLFVFSEKTVRKQFRRFLHAFRNRYPNTYFAWSYKTNYLKAISSIYHQEGSIAEVVSEFEYQKARKLGIEGKDIIFNGPFKEKSSLVTAVKEGAKIHIDHFDELLLLEEISKEYNLTPKVAVRINMDTGIYPSWSRFGFNFENKEAERTIVRILTHKKMVLEGLHTHIGTFVLSTDAYEKALKKLLTLYDLSFEKYQHKIKYIDIGGGIPSLNKLKSQYLPTSITVPSIEQYAEKITDLLNNHFQKGDGPDLYLETGRALIDDAGFLISTVHTTKRLPDQRRALVVDAGVNLLFTSYFYDINVALGQEYEGTTEPTVIYGPLCMNIDVIRESISLPYLIPNDKLIFYPVGAYNVTQWMQFIQMRPAVILIDEKGVDHLIRRKETIDDIELCELLPKHLELIEEL